MDESIWVIGAIFLGGWVVLLPIVTLVMAMRARSEAGRAHAALAELGARVDAWRRSAVPAAAAAVTREVETVHVPAPSSVPMSPPELPQLIESERPVPVSVPVPPPVRVLDAQILPTPSPTPRAPAEASPVPPPTVPLPAAPVRAAAAPGESSLEEKIALVWFTRIGAMALLLGVAYFFKYAVDNAWIGPLGRVAVGAVAGVALLGFGEKIRPTTRPSYVWMVLGVGLSFLYVSAYASFAFYHLAPLPLAFGAIFVITCLGGALAIHHGAEPILVLALVAGFLCPVLLSTGENRLGGLTVYLLVLTSLAYAVALRMRFQVSVWLGMLGTLVLLLGWYARFFNLEGAGYALVAARTLPLSVVGIFVAQWVGLYFAARHFNSQLSRTWVLLGALSLGHLGFAVLLPDSPVLLGALLAGLAALGVVLLGAEDRRDLLGIPLSLAFIVLAWAVHGTAAGDSSLPVMGVLGVLSLVYVGAFLRGRLFQPAKLDKLSLALVGAAGVGFLVVAGLLLLGHHPRQFALAVALVSLGYASLSWMVGVPVVALVAVVFSFVAMGLATPWSSRGDWKLVAIAALWAFVYFASGAYELLVRRVPPTALRLFTVSAAGLGFLVLAEPQMGAQAWTLRAALLAVVGILDLGIGSILLQRGQRSAATALLGQALGLFAAAAACYFSGSAITVIWAILGAVLAVLAAEAEDRWWLTGACLFFGAALVRVVGVDLPASDALRELFFSSLGRSGELAPRWLFNGRTVALVGTAAALFVAARACARRTPRLFQSAAALFVGVGHALLLTCLTLEAYQLALHTPLPPPRGASPEEFEEFVRVFGQAVAAHASRLSMVTTLVFSAYAALLVGIGFGARERLHRYLGLGLFALALAKLVLWDVWHLPRLYQMMVLILVGALLLGASFLYARFGRRLVTLLREGAVVRSVAGALLVGLALAGTRAEAVEPSRFEWTRPVQSITGPGYFTLELDADIYLHSREDEGDLRVLGPQGEEVPFLVRAVEPVHPPLQHPATLVDPVTLPGGGARAVLDLGEPGLKHSEVTLLVSGVDFIRTTRVEVSSDEVHYALLAEGMSVFRVASGDAQAEQLTLRYPTSDARYLRVTVLPGPDGQSLTLFGAQVAYAEAGAAARPRRSRPLALSKPRPSPAHTPPASEAEDHSVQQLVLDAQSPGVPLEEITFDIQDAEFERHVRILASNEQSYWAPVATAVVFRAPRGKAPQRAVESLTVRIPPQRTRYLRVEIDRGDNAPLEVRGAHGSYAPRELLLRAAAPGDLRLLLGSAEATAPTYDLAAVLSRSGEVVTHPATWGALAPNPRFHAQDRSTEAKSQSFSDRHGAWLGAALLVLLALLGGWTWNLMRKAPPTT